MRLVTMATRWSLGARVSRVIAMVTASTRVVASCVTVRRVSAWRVLGTLRARTVDAVSVDITALQ